MEDIEHPTLIEEWKQNIHADAYENKLYKDVKLPSINKKSIVIMKQNTSQKA